MKTDLHPTWFPQATVICACGNTWQTGATIETIRTDICSACHPFFTGEQRIVDTEGQVDRFMKRLQHRDSIRQEEEDRIAARTSPNLGMTELGLAKRYLNIFSEHGIEVVGEFMEKLQQGGDDALLEIPGIGRKILADIKRELRNRGYELPETVE